MPPHRLQASFSLRAFAASQHLNTIGGMVSFQLLLRLLSSCCEDIKLCNRERMGLQSRPSTRHSDPPFNKSYWEGNRAQRDAPQHVNRIQQMLLRFISCHCKKEEPDRELKGAFLAYPLKFLTIYKLFLDSSLRALLIFLPPWKLLL